MVSNSHQSQGAEKRDCGGSTQLYWRHQSHTPRLSPQKRRCKDPKSLGQQGTVKLLQTQQATAYRNSYRHMWNRSHEALPRASQWKCQDWVGAHKVLPPGRGATHTEGSWELVYFPLIGLPMFTARVLARVRLGVWRSEDREYVGVSSPSTVSVLETALKSSDSAASLPSELTYQPWIWLMCRLVRSSR